LGGNNISGVKNGVFVYKGAGEWGEVCKRRKGKGLLPDDLKESWVVGEVGLEGKGVGWENGWVGIRDTLDDDLVLGELVQESWDKDQVNSVLVGDLTVGFVEFFREISTRTVAGNVWGG